MTGYAEFASEIIGRSDGGSNLRLGTSGARGGEGAGWSGAGGLEEFRGSVEIGIGGRRDD